MDSRARLLLLIHAGATLFMTGLVWFVQVAHYPLLALIAPAAFAAYERANIARTAAIAGPVMVLEAATALLLLEHRPAVVRKGEAWLGAALLALIWSATALLLLPTHLALTQGFDEELLRQLTLSNWLRVLGWSARAVLVLRVLQRAVKP
jgi:hypothetical protein